MNMVDIILIHTGNYFYDYIEDCIHQLKKFNFKIHLVISEKLISSFNISNIIISKAEDYFDDRFKKYQILGHDTNFKDGFWTRTSNRFFILNSYVKKNKIENFFHIENDNLIFTNLDDINFFLKKSNYEMAVVIDSENRCIPSIIWFRNYNICDLLSNHIYENNYYNDMSNLFLFFYKNRNIVTNLPILPENIDKSNLISKSGIKYSGNINYSNFFKDLNCIFDGASIGQYLTGIDNRNGENTIGFINETTIFNVSEFTFEWILNCPVMIYNEDKIKINNLHIHSKNLELINIKII